MRTSPRSAQQGFTLIELIMSVVLLGFLTAFGASMIYDNMRTVVLVNSGQGSLDRARLAMGRLSREIREVKVGAGAAYSITSALTAGTSSLTFVRDISGVATTVTIGKTG